MLNKKQVLNFKMECATWLEFYIRFKGVTPIKEVYKAGKEKGFTRAQIKAARAWLGKWVTTVDDDSWGWDLA